MKLKTLLITLTCALGAQADDVTFKLATELLEETRHEQAATEFRRFAMESENPTEQASGFLYAGFSYLQENQPQFALEMIDRAESTDQTGALTIDRTLLSADAAKKLNDLDSAVYYYDLLTEDAQNPDTKQFALRHAAALELMQNNPEAAQLRLQNNPDELSALNTYLNRNDKSPRTAAIWGIIPGAGYFYTGEYANGFRNLILNGLFMFGMAQTASDDQWGAFTVISFFELTWYSGSIYGGIDSAHRYNQNRLNEAIREIEGPSYLRPDETTIPLFKLKVQF